MKYIKRFSALLFSILMLGGIFAFVGTQEASGQRTVRRVIYRPIIVRRPYWYYDPFYNPYHYDPYIRARQELRSRQNSVRKEEEDLAEDRAEAYADGVITAKEREELEKDRRQLARARQRLRQYQSYYRY